jgi:hypothetical protein
VKTTPGHRKSANRSFVRRGVWRGIVRLPPCACVRRPAYDLLEPLWTTRKLHTRWPPSLVCRARSTSESATKLCRSVARVKGITVITACVERTADANRVGRVCTYQNDEQGLPTDDPITVSDAIGLPRTITVDPFSYDRLRMPYIDMALRDEAFRTLGDVDDVRSIAQAFFSKVWYRMPFLSEKRFMAALPQIYAQPQSDYLLLCLAINLVLQRPKQPSSIGETMQTALYLAVKTWNACLEAANVVTLNFVQTRLLVCYYEVGHGLYPAASASIAACAVSSRASGLVSKSRAEAALAGGISRERQSAEEEKRTVWAIINLDRYESNLMVIDGN